MTSIPLWEGGGGNVDGGGEVHVWGQGTRETLYTLLSFCWELKTALERESL